MPFDTYHSGASAGSEPETRALDALRGACAAARDALVPPGARHRRALAGRPGARAALLAAARGSRGARLPRYHGTADGWQNHRFPGDTAFVVELPGGRLLGRRRRAPRRGGAGARPRRRAPAGRGAPDPVRRAPRKAEMRAYARRHYGIDDYRLRKPRVIVEHYTATEQLRSPSSTRSPPTRRTSSWASCPASARTT